MLNNFDVLYTLIYRCKYKQTIIVQTIPCHECAFSCILFVEHSPFLNLYIITINKIWHMYLRILIVFIIMNNNQCHHNSFECYDQ